MECEKYQTSVSLNSEARIMLRKRAMEYDVEVLLDELYCVMKLALLSTEKSIEVPPRLGRPVDQNWIDLETLKDWRTRCFKAHGDTCNRAAAWKSTFSDRPRLLIDAKLVCIAHAKPSDSYIALSYVWGSTKQLKTTNDCLDILLQEGSLKKQEMQAKIPRTVSDSIQLTAILGERYIWIDSLCIIQDNDDFKNDQIKAMASIYSNASFTIVAANGENSDAGLHGIRGISKPRSFIQPVYQLGHQHSFVRHVHKRFHSCVWSKRGWTFQEAKLSARLLVFSEDTVHWQCQCAMWREDGQADDASVPIHERSSLRYTVPVDELALFVSPWPRFDGSTGLVETFNTKQLTYPEDILPAFSGITNVL